MDEERRGALQIAADAAKQLQDRINQSWLGRSIDWVSHNFGATIRQGAKEIAQVLPAFPDSVRPVEELGTMGNPTQLEVNQEKGNVWERDKGFDEWLERGTAAARKPPENDMGREL